MEPFGRSFKDQLVPRQGSQASPRKAQDRHADGAAIRLVKVEDDALPTGSGIFDRHI